MSPKRDGFVGRVLAWRGGLLTRIQVTRRVRALVVLIMALFLPACGWGTTKDCPRLRDFWYCTAVDSEDADDDGIALQYDCKEGDPDIGGLYVGEDADADGFAGTEGYGLALGCTLSVGFSDVFGDCDDTDPKKIAVDTWFTDLDGDTWGSGDGEALCASEDGYATRGEDCADTNAAVNPGVAEVPDDGVDNDCDGAADDDAPTGSYSSADAEATWTGLADDELSYSVSAVGDVTGAGGAGLAIGSPGAEDTSRHAVGAVDVYGGPFVADEEAGTRTFGRLWGSHEGDRAGAAVAGLGDLDGDGYDDLIVGSPGVEEGGFSGGPGTGGTGPEGAAYVVYGPVDPGSSVQLEDSRHVAVLNASESGGQLGSSVTALGDYLGDGLPAFAVSAPTVGGRWAEVSTEGGQVYLLEGVSEHEQEVGAVALASLSGEEEYGRFGAVMAGGKDLNGDGRLDLVVGSPTDRADLRDSGEAFNTTGAGTAWVLLEPVYGDAAISLRAETSLTGPATSALASAVSLIDDLDGDGSADLALGAPFDDSYAEDGGAIYLLSGAALEDLAPGEVASSAALLSVVRGPSAMAYLGWSVADAGDIDEDGQSELLCGGPGLDDGAGAAWLLGDPAGGDQVEDATMRVEGPFPYGWTGRTVGAADLNGLGRPDLLISSVEDAAAFAVDATPGHLSLFFMDRL